MKTYSWHAPSLASAYTIEQLVELRQLIESDPANRNPPGSVNIFTRMARKKLHAIEWAIVAKLAQAKKEAA